MDNVKSPLSTNSQSPTLSEADRRLGVLNTEMEPLTSPQERELIDIFSGQNTLVDNIFGELDRFVNEIIYKIPNKQQELHERYDEIKFELSSYLKKQNKNKQKKESPTMDFKKYLLKDSRRYSTGWKDIPKPKSVDDGIKSIQDCQRNIAQLKSNVLHFYIQIGRVLFNIKDKVPDSIIPKLKENGILYSMSYVNFLIKLYTLAKQFPRIQFLTLAIRVVKQKFCQLKEEVENHPDFWKL